MSEIKEKEKVQWLKSEKRMRIILVLALISTIALITTLIFFREQIWAVVVSSLTEVSLIIGIIANVKTILKKEDR